MSELCLLSKLDKQQRIDEIVSNPVETFKTVRKLKAENAALRAEVERLNALSVTNIMIDVAPGWDGSGEEVFAKSVDDVESLLSKLSEKAEDFDLVTEPLRQQLAISQLEAKRLRDELDILTQQNSSDEFTNVRSKFIADARKALSSPTSTEALDAYVAEKVKETESRWQRAFDEGMRFQRKCEELTRQRDLAVSAATKARNGAQQAAMVCSKKLHVYPALLNMIDVVDDALAAIKESEV